MRRKDSRGGVKPKSWIAAANKRITDFDRLVERIYEDNIVWGDLLAALRCTTFGGSFMLEF